MQISGDYKELANTGSSRPNDWECGRWMRWAQSPMPTWWQCPFFRSCCEGISCSHKSLLSSSKERRYLNTCIVLTLAFMWFALNYVTQYHKVKIGLNIFHACSEGNYCILCSALESEKLNYFINWTTCLLWLENDAQHHLWAIPLFYVSFNSYLNLLVL